MTAIASAESSTRCVVGSTVPRLWTRPLRELTPETSYGFAVVDFARDILERPLDPWQEWLVIHAGELLEDGRPRFRKVLVLVARQNGKTELLVILSLFWLFVQSVPLVLGTSTNLDYARESWEKAVLLVEDVPELAEDIPPRTGVRRANGEQTLTTSGRCRYKIAASNRKGGRSLTVHRLIMDELREHHDFEAWNAAYPAMNAVRDAQAWAITNQGDVRAVVLDSLRDPAVEALETGEIVDPRLGLFEWSAPPGSQATDVEALLQANPNAGRRIELEDLLADARRAELAGGDQLAGFKTEILCMRVPLLDPAIDVEAFAECLDPGDMLAVRSRVALVFDVALDSQHATLYAAAQMPDGRTRIEPVEAWDGPGCTHALLRDMPGHVRRVKPQRLGWIPNGPAAAVAAGMAKRKGWPPVGVEFAEIRSEATAVCMGFAEQITARQIAHSDDPLLNDQIKATEKLPRGDAWVFTRRGAGHCDASYAAAGAVHLARTMPPPPPRPLVLVGKRPTDTTPETANRH